MRKSKNRYFYHIFVSPGDIPGAITLNVVRMERDYKLSRSMYPSIFNSFPVIRTASAKNRPFHVPQPTFLFPPETPLLLSRNMLHGWKENSMPSIYYRFWDTAIYLGKSRHFIIPVAFDAPLGGFPSENRHPLWDGKTRMVSLPEDEKISKISLFVLTWSTNVTDGRTDRRTDRQTLRDSIDRACIASRGKNEVKMAVRNAVQDMDIVATEC